MGKGVFGLVLAGGKSSRMGQDKGLINWRGKSQKYFIADLLVKHCENVFISCKTDQIKNIDNGYSVIVDNANYSDSYGAIRSALEKYPEKAWLIIACDMPFVDNPSIETLASARDPNKIATTYSNPDNNLPEPMFAIWEPKSLKILQEFAELGINCPRKALIKCGDQVKLVKPKDRQIIANVNTPEDANNAREIIDAKQ